MLLDVGAAISVGVSLLVIGFLGGMAVSRASAAKERRALSQALARAQDELEALRAATADHFNRAGELFADLTDRYVACYRHLARGAATLTGGRAREFPELILTSARSIDDGRGASPGGTAPAEEAGGPSRPSS